MTEQINERFTLLWTKGEAKKIKFNTVDVEIKYMGYANDGEKLEFELLNVSGLSKILLKILKSSNFGKMRVELGKTYEIANIRIEDKPLVKSTLTPLELIAMDDNRDYMLKCEVSTEFDTKVTDYT